MAAMAGIHSDLVQLEDFVEDEGEGPSNLEKESAGPGVSLKCSLTPRSRAYKNVLGAGASAMLSFSVLVALDNLQSSFNEAEGLGYSNLAIGSATFIIFGLFGSSLIKLLGTKYSLIVSYFCALVYAGANYYPQWYTLVPGAICNGIAQTIMFAAGGIHVTNMAMEHASALNEKTDHLIAFFNGLYSMFLKLTYIPGNAAITAILFSERQSSDREIVDSSLGSVCNNTDVKDLDQTYVYILMSSFVVIDIVAIVLAFILLDHPGTESRSGGVIEFYIKEPIVAALRMFLEWKIYFIFLLILLPSFVTATVLGIMIKFYISDCIGVHWVGLFSLTYGICSAVSTVITGRLFKCVPHFLIVYSFTAVMTGTVIFLLFWEREPNYLIVFTFIAILGLCEGMWFNLPPTLVGVLFPTRKIPAFTVIRMFQGVGYTVAVIVPLFAVITVSLWMEISLIVIALISYSVLLFTTHNRKQIFPLCYSADSSTSV